MPLLPGRDYLLLFFRGKIRHSGKFYLQIATQHNVSTTTRHIGCDGHCAGLTGLCHDFGFARMLFGIQNLMLNLVFI
jgi:hypothetical protein